MIAARVVSLLAAAALAGCGGGSSGGNPPVVVTPPPPPQPNTLTGVFLDSPVIGIGYRTASITDGVTDSLGQFEYLDGESVTFFIGDLELPAVTASSVITPLDIVGTQDTSDVTVVNIIRLLQTLDEDGDATNGLTISDAAKSAATQVDFSASLADFETSVATLVANGSPNTALIPAEVAIAQFEDTLAQEDIEFLANASIVGAWTSTATSNDLLALVFLEDGAYVHMQIDFDDPNLTPGMEWGTYARDAATGRLTVTQEFDRNGGAGLTDYVSGQFPLAADVAGDRLTIRFDDNQDGQLSADEFVELRRVIPDGLTGAWIPDPAAGDENDFLMLLFFNDGTYAHLEIDFDNQDEISGMEWGTYSRDAETGLLTVAQVFDQNGGTGFTDFVDGTLPVAADLTAEGIRLRFDDNQDGEFGTDEFLDFVRVEPEVMFSIDLIGKSATSVITLAECPGVPGGFEYEFSQTDITLTGTDGWQTPACVLNDSETFSITIADLPANSDIPFACVAYPVCTISDLEKFVTGIDLDDRPFTSRQTFDRQTLTYKVIKQVGDGEFTEVITINP